MTRPGAKPLHVFSKKRAEKVLHRSHAVRDGERAEAFRRPERPGVRFRHRQVQGGRLHHRPAGALHGSL